MGIFSGLFGGGRRKKPSASDKKPSAVDVRELAAPLAVPAVHLVRTDAQTPCYFGGRPALPPGVVWPSRNGKPLSFLASLDVAAIASVLPLDWLPSAGRLLFFYDIDAQPWGFDPKDRDSWSVMYFDGDTGTCESGTVASPLPTVFLSPRRIASLPSYERPQVSALQLSEEQTEELIDFANSVYGQSPCHQVGGYPSPIQGDEMELECQLASHGIYVGDQSGYRDPRAVALRDGARDWMLLLQIDSDDALRIMWGDAGVVYFWIREQDARARRFENAWLVLQCH